LYSKSAAGSHVDPSVLSGMHPPNHCWRYRRGNPAAITAMECILDSPGNIMPVLQALFCGTTCYFLSFSRHIFKNAISMIEKYVLPRVSSYFIIAVSGFYG
jgi:hypothetical protein